MHENIIKLKNDFQFIKAMGWIKSISNDDGSVGITFESLLGKKENNSVLPDYSGIELKCSASKYAYPITLFSINFDGPTKYETQRIANLYGKRDSIFKDKNMIYASLKCNGDYLVYNKYYFRLKIDKKLRRIYLVISDTNRKIIEEKCYISYNTLENHLYTKLSYLAMITASKKSVDGQTYFNYVNLELFKLKSFEYFINAIEEDKIKINLILRISKSNANYGNPSYKNLTFSIPKYNLKYIFSKLLLN